MHHAWAGNRQTHPRATGQIAHRARSVAGRLLIAKAVVIQTFALHHLRQIDDREAENAKHVFNTLLFERSRDDGRAV